MPYKTQSSDTCEAVDRLQFEHLRKKGRKARFEQALANTDESLEMMWRSLVRLRPNATPQELHVEWARVQFGEEFATKIAEFLKWKTPAHIETPFAKR